MAPSRTFHVYSQGGGFNNNVFLVDGSDDKTRLYKMHYKYSSILSRHPDIDIVRLGSPHKGKSSTKTVVGTVAHRSFSKKLDLTIRNVPVVMDKNRAYRWGGSFTSIFPGVGTLTWQGEDIFARAVELVDGRGMKFARYQKINLSTKRMATFEILVDPMPSQEVLDEIAVTGLAVMFELGRKTKSSHHRAIRGIGSEDKDGS